MADFDQLQGLLSNPQLMQQLYSMANAMGMAPPAQPRTPPQDASPMPFDPAMLQNLQQMLQGIRLEPRQQQLLSALESYLPPDRISRLHRAMQAAKLASMASHTSSQGR